MSTTEWLVSYRLFRNCAANTSDTITTTIDVNPLQFWLDINRQIDNDENGMGKWSGCTMLYSDGPYTVARV